jgi:hypothetical protein
VVQLQVQRVNISVVINAYVLILILNVLILVLNVLILVNVIIFGTFL